MAGRGKVSDEDCIVCPCCGRKLAVPLFAYFGDNKIRSVEIIRSTVHISEKYESKQKFKNPRKNSYFCVWCWAQFDKVTGKIYRFGMDMLVPIRYEQPNIHTAQNYSRCRKYMEEQDRLWMEGKQ